MAGDEDAVARARAGAQEGSAFTDLSEHCEIDRDRGRAGRVAASQAHSEFARGAGHAGEETVEPSLRKSCRQGQTEEVGAWLRAHRREIACGARECLVTD